MHVKKVQSFVDVVPIFGNQMFGDSCCTLSITSFNFRVTTNLCGDLVTIHVLNNYHSYSHQGHTRKNKVNVHSILSVNREQDFHLSNLGQIEKIFFFYFSLDS